MSSEGYIHIAPNYTRTPMPRESTQNRRKIAVALDDSEFSKYALEWTLDHLIIPDRDAIILTSVAIIQDTGDYLSSLTESSEQRQNRLKRRGDNYAQKILDEAGAIIKSRSDKLGSHAKVLHEIFCLGAGDPRSVIVDFCQTNEVDLLVMGHRGRGMIAK